MTDSKRVQDALDKYQQLRAANPDITISYAARAIGIPRRTLSDNVRRFGLHGIKPEIVVPTPPEGEPIADLVARKKALMKIGRAQEDWQKLIQVQVTTDGPIGLLLVGDPHIDDDGCDIAQLEHDLSVVGATRGFYAGHLGDVLNNWVGRLAALYAHQSTTFSDGLRLVEWMFGLCPNLFTILGNHCMWNQGADLTRMILQSAGQPNPHAHGLRMQLNWPNGKNLRLNARHDFRGKSQFSTTHGHKRELLWGHRDHILVAGHLHVDEARVEPLLDGDAAWMFRVSGYKVFDSYAKELGLHPSRLAPSVSVVLNPDAAVPAERVKPFWDVDTAAEYLTWLRSRRG
jgi:hypothetical protein